MVPKVFVCHATEDKDRFVSKFGARLIENGIDAWVDQWEIAAGDRLTTKIFDEGIKQAKLFIIVLSKYSIEKPWVNEELDAAVVTRIERGTKIVPIVLDNCEVPLVLRATRWVIIEDVNAYDAKFREVVNAVFGRSDKPSLGVPPAYVDLAFDRLSGLSKIDTLILKIICELALESKGGLTSKGLYMQPDEIESHVKVQSISHQEFIDSLRILHEENYIETTLAHAQYVLIVHFLLLPNGFEQYLQTYLSNYASIKQDVISQIVNKQQTDGEQLSESISQPYNLVKHILFSLERQKYMKLTQTMADTVRVYDVSPRLSRLLKD